MASENTEKEVILLDCWGSMFGMRARIALAEKKVSYEYREEDIPYNKSPLLLQMNPVHEKIPVLIHKNRPICESLNIVTYIDDVWAHNDDDKLLPKDPYLRAQARFWGDYVDKKLYVAAWRVWQVSDVAEIGDRREALLEVLRVLEKEIGDKAFFAGDEFGFVDVALIGFYPWFPVYEKYGGFSVEAQVPGISAWASRCLKKKSVSDALPDGERVLKTIQVFREAR